MNVSKKVNLNKEDQIKSFKYKKSLLSYYFLNILSIFEEKKTI